MDAVTRAQGAGPVAMPMIPVTMKSRIQIPPVIIMLGNPARDQADEPCCDSPPEAGTEPDDQRAKKLCQARNERHR